MTAQGISISSSEGVKNSTVNKMSKKKNDSNDFMSVIQDAQNKGSTNDKKEVVKPVNQELNHTRVEDKKVSSIQCKNQENDVKMNELDTDDVNAQVVMVLKNVFDLSDQDIEDLLNQFGINAIDFLQNPNDILLQTTEISTNLSMINVGQVKDFVMDMFGVEDDSAFLMSDILDDKFQQLLTGLTELTDEIKEFGNLDQFLTTSTEETEIVDQLPELKTAFEVDFDLQNDTISEMPTENMMETTIPSQTETQMQMDSNEEQGSSLTDDRSVEVKSARAEESNADTVRDSQTTANPFMEQLKEAVQGTTDELSKTSETAQNIVNQIVKHVRVRVIPQTTSMDMILNPESLGRVHLSVSTTNGVSQATLTVENQVAKEALESQMITLQETFAEKGLKVTEVEVNVSEFGFAQDKENSGQEEMKHSGKSSKGNRQRLSALDDSEEELETEERTSNHDGMIDYTA